MSETDDRNQKIMALDNAMDEATIASAGFLGGTDLLEALQSAHPSYSRNRAINSE